MKLIVGLGNPGDRYLYSRHNVGFRVINKLAEDLRLDFGLSEKHKSLVANSKLLILVKPQTFMNDSGKAVSSIASFYKIKANDLWVIHDDLDIPLGRFKIQKGRGPKVHGGVNSIEKKLGRYDFWRVRIGVDNRIDERTSGEDYILQNFTENEEEVIASVLEDVASDLIKRFK